MVNCNRSSYQQVIHILHSLQAPSRYSTLQARKRMNIHFPIAWVTPIPSQYNLSNQIHQWLGPRKASHPYITEGILDKNWVLRSTFKDNKSFQKLWVHKLELTDLKQLTVQLYETWSFLCIRRYQSQKLSVHMLEINNHQSLDDETAHFLCL